jgi:hypothetical protein
MLVNLFYHSSEVVTVIGNLSEALASIRNQISELVDEIKGDPRFETILKLFAALNNLEDVMGVPRTSLQSMMGFGDQPSHVDSHVSSQPDAFYGLEPLEAAKRFLKTLANKPSKSALFTDIVRAIRAGGGDPGNEDKLRLSLARSTFEVAKIGEDRFGLLEFFPHVKRGGKKKKNGSDPKDPQESGAQPISLNPDTCEEDDSEGDHPVNSEV